VSLATVVTGKVVVSAILEDIARMDAKQFVLQARTEKRLVQKTKLMDVKIAQRVNTRLHEVKHRVQNVKLVSTRKRANRSNVKSVYNVQRLAFIALKEHPTLATSLVKKAPSCQHQVLHLLRRAAKSARKVFTNLNQVKPAARNVQLECFYLIKVFRQ